MIYSCIACAICRQGTAALSCAEQHAMATAAVGPGGRTLRIRAWSSRRMRCSNTFLLRSMACCTCAGLTKKYRIGSGQGFATQDSSLQPDFLFCNHAKPQALPYVYHTTTTYPSQARQYCTNTHLAGHAAELVQLFVCEARGQVIRDAQRGGRGALATQGLRTAIHARIVRQGLQGLGWVSTVTRLLKEHGNYNAAGVNRSRAVFMAAQERPHACIHVCSRTRLASSTLKSLGRGRVSRGLRPLLMVCSLSLLVRWL